MAPTVHAMDLPSAREFILSAGFASVVALLAAIVVLGAVLHALRRAEKRSDTKRDQEQRHHEELRADSLHAAEVQRCWDRWWQVQQSAALEPAASEGVTLGLGPDVVLELLRSLLRDAEALGDDTLTTAIAACQEQLLLVLAQQGGPLAHLPAAAETSTNGDTTTTAARKRPSPRAASPLAVEPKAAPKSVEKDSAATEKVPTGKPRR